MQTTDSDESLGAIEQLRAMQRAHREWFPHLTNSQRTFLCYLLDNTILWGRTTVNATVDQMIRGNRWLPKLYMGRTTAFQAFADLRACGLVKATENQGITQLSINLDWLPTMLKKPKRLREKQIHRTTIRWSEDAAPTAGIDDESLVPNLNKSSPKSGLSQSQVGTLYKNKNKHRKEQAKTTSSRGASHRGSLPEETNPENLPAPTAIAAIASVRGKAKLRRESADARVPKDHVVWVDAWALAFPASRPTVWGKAERGMVKTLRKRAEQMGLPWHEFFAWCVQNWSALRAAKFAWMRSSPAPVEPSVRFLLGFADRFFDAYAERETLDRLRVAVGEEAEVERMQLAGMTREDALIELGKRRAIAEHRETIAKDKAEVSRLFRAAERANAVQPVAKRTHKERPTPEIKHGTNPYDNGGLDMPTFDPVQDWPE